MSDEGVFAIFATIGAILFGLFVWAVIAEAREWETFRAAHECKIVGKMSGDVFNTFDAKGNVGIGFTSGKTGWSCNDGVTYWK